MRISGHLARIVPHLLLFALALHIRLAGQHAALLYPDGYQYLLMARGIGEHLRPTTVLGHGGEAFVPSADAAAKPLFPLLVAALHALGASWLGAARIVTAAAGASTIVLAALLTLRLTGSRLAGASAALLLLASPSLGFWSGFSGPDPLAQALGLGAALAFVHRSPRLGGVLTALAVAARPELLVVALAAATVGARDAETRAEAGRAALASTLTLALILGAIRPPIAMPDLELVWLAPLLLVAVGLALAAPRSRIPVGVAVVVGLGAVAVGSLTAPGLVGLWSDDWPLLGLGLAGFAVAALDRSRRSAALKVLLIGVLLGAVYWVKNPTLERYFVLLLPLAALLAGLGVATLPRPGRRLATGAVALAVVAGFLRAPAPEARQPDVFSAVATRLSRSLPSSEPLVTAAPDAYGFWLPTQPVRTMRPGARGMILLDAAQRSYAPELGARGRIVARFEDEMAFVRPGGEIDAGPAVLVAGRVVLARSRALPTPS